MGKSQNLDVEFIRGCPSLKKPAIMAQEIQRHHKCEKDGMICPYIIGV
jgi:hypothetical protein